MEYEDYHQQLLEEQQYLEEQNNMTLTDKFCQDIKNNSHKIFANAVDTHKALLLLTAYVEVNKALNLHHHLFVMNEVNTKFKREGEKNE